MAEGSPPADEVADAEQGPAHGALAVPHLPGGATQPASVPMHARMWHVIAAAAVQQGALAGLVKALPHLAPKWLISSASLASVAAGCGWAREEAGRPAASGSTQAQAVWQQMVETMLVVGRIS